MSKALRIPKLALGSAVAAFVLLSFAANPAWAFVPGLASSLLAPAAPSMVTKAVHTCPYGYGGYYGCRPYGYFSFYPGHHYRAHHGHFGGFGHRGFARYGGFGHGGFGGHGGGHGGFGHGGGHGH